MIVLGNGNVAIGTTSDSGFKLDVNGTARIVNKLSVGTPSAASALMEVTSTTLGFLPPRMTTTQKNAISSPASGLVVYDSTLNVLNFYNGSSWTSGSSGGTVTSVAALTLGTTGTDLSSTVATGTTTPVITLNVPDASATNRGALTATDWATFNNKQNALGFTAVPTTRTISTTAPLSGGGDLSADRTLSMAAATTSVNGYLTSTDWTTFNNKQAALVSGTNIKTVNGNTLLGSGNLVIPVFQLQGTNYLSVLANGTPAQNGQAVRDAYTAAQAMTPNGAAKSSTNRVVILLAPGYYTFSEATLGAFTVNQSYIDFESLSGVTDVYFSSMQVTSPFPGINVRISGINTLVNNYYTHGAFAVASTGDPSEDIYIKNCVGGDYSFCAFSSAFLGTIENCVALNFSFLYGTTVAPPAGIVSSGSGSVSLYGTFKNCTAGSNSFVRAAGVGYVESYGTIDNCTAAGSSFLSGGTMYTSNYGTISNCFSTGTDSFCTGNYVENISRIVNCTSLGGYSFVVTINPSGNATNSGLISNCECSGLDPSFVIKATATYTGSNLNARIINCTALNSDAAFCGDLGFNTGLISNCIAWQQAFCCNNAAGLTRDILRCTMTNDTFTSGITSGGRVVLGIDTTGVVNY